MTDHLQELVRGHKAGEPVGIYSVCSAHPLVLEAAVRQAMADDSFVLIEATSNQVDQFGGYTGMTPATFRTFVGGIAGAAGLPLDRVVLGGDHLGPNRWQDQPAQPAMAHAETLVAAYVAAGFTKIHLDCSMSCADDPAVLSPEVVAARAARLAGVAERVAAGRAHGCDVRYVIGTEVPVPGGAHETLGKLTPTHAAAARATIAQHREAFDRAGVAAAWPRVIGLVVQPGVEFDHVQVIDYRREAARELSQVVEHDEHLVYEAHSTDYQTRDNLTALVQDHFAVLKVGPGLTFALREGLFALEAIEAELVADSARSSLAATVEECMVKSPGDWERYYTGEPGAQRLARRYSFSDRMRYYWPDPAIQAAQTRLFANLGETGVPLPLLSQYLPDQYRRVRRGEIMPQPHELVVDRVRDVLRDYASACRGGFRPSGP